LVQVEENRRRAAREAELVAELEREKERNAKREEEEHRKNQQAYEAAQAAQAAAEAKAQAAREQAEQTRNFQNRVDWLLQGSRWTRQEDSKIFHVWATYAAIPRPQRTGEALVDAAREALSHASDEPSYAWHGLFFRRAYADFKHPGSFAFGNLGQTLILSTSWDTCRELATALVSRNFKEMSFLKDIGFTSLYCYKNKQSTVTGNIMVETDKYWPIK
jgi:hypothetical protein